MIKDIEGFKQELLEYGYRIGVEYSILEHDETGITIEFKNLDPFEEFVTIHEGLHDFVPDKILDTKFISMTVKWYDPSIDKHRKRIQ